MDRQAATEGISGIARNPLKSVLDWKERTGGKVLGCLSCMPFFCPEELAHAAGLLPVGVWGAEVAVSLADARLQSFACSMVRTSLEMGLRGKLEACDGFLFPSTCDALQNLSEVWKKSVDVPCFEMVFPRQVSRPSSVSFLRRQLERLQEKLERFAGVTISQDVLRRSCTKYNENRNLMRRLDQRRGKEPFFLTCQEMTEVVLASSCIPKDEHTELVRSLLEPSIRRENGQQTEKREGRDLVRIFLSGVMPRPLEVLSVLEAAGGWIVGDDLGLGSLYYSLEIPDSGDCLGDLARAYLGYPACSTVHDDSRGRAGSLLAGARWTGAEAVIVLALKFCEPEFFDYPHIKESLEKEGIPVLLLETELGTAETGSLRTRVEAFLETLRAR